MAKWLKRFRAWETAKQPIQRREVEAVLQRVFGDRVTVNKAGSHRWTVSVPELAESDPDFRFGQFTIPLDRGRRVKAPYCQLAYRAALSLGLLDDRDDDAENDDEDDS
jgi:hypothetical protein